MHEFLLLPLVHIRKCLGILKLISRMEVPFDIDFLFVTRYTS
ncbi:hypothetical protein ALTERO38_60089 [Alteromonas sp. 38]|nr:hypothetical protein ALTERO38_60089 [Alteromonas sp. 38]